jgi:2-polyprenyl-3-methyl-5-hydroxy-6-metoxy-1,4-benzoquinol methylase
MRFYKNHIELPHEAVLLFNKISNLFNLEKAEAESLFPAYFIYYHRGYFSGEWNFEQHAHYFYDIFQVTEAQEARVLDVGCGFGLMSIFFETFGAAEVTGIDLDTEKICGFKSLLKFVNMEDGHVKIELGDALNIGFSGRTFDVIIVNDVLSHVRELEKFLEEISRLLVPGGRLYLYDDNNKLFLPNMFEHRRLWKRCEKGPLDISTLRGTDEHLPYAEIRKKMILNLEPYCSPSNLEYLAKKTAGIYGKELESAVAEFRMTGKIKKHKGFKYRNPKTGEFPERPLNPYMISKALRNMGFSSRALPTFFFVESTGLKGSIKKVLSLIFRMNPSLSFIIAPSFRILSIKTKA